MERDRMTSMLAWIAAIRGELDDWERPLHALPGGKDACEATVAGLIDLKWCLEAALEAEAPEEQ